MVGDHMTESFCFPGNAMCMLEVEQWLALLRF